MLDTACMILNTGSMRWKKNKSQENNYENNNYIKVSVEKNRVQL